MATITPYTVGSKRFLYIREIEAFDADSPDAATDPSTLPIYVAFLAAGVAPVDDDWHAAEWTGANDDGVGYDARIKLGPSDVVLTAGTYEVRLRVTGAVEEPRDPVGYLQART